VAGLPRRDDLRRQLAGDGVAAEDAGVDVQELGHEKSLFVELEAEIAERPEFCR
jgi:hypothetical protein